MPHYFSDYTRSTGEGMESAESVFNAPKDIGGLAYLGELENWPVVGTKKFRYFFFKR